jgi:HEAT repeat protein
VCAAAAGVWLGLAGSAGADEPRPLGRIYRERIRVALRETAAGGRSSGEARARFFRIVGARHLEVGAELERMLGESESWEDRAAAATGLGLLGQRHAVPALAGRLTEEGSARVRAAAASALGACGGPMARRVLMDLAGDDLADRVRLAAVEALPATGEPSVPWALARSMRGPETRDGARARALLTRMGFTPEEQAVVGRSAVPAADAPKEAAARWVRDGEPSLLVWVLWGPADPAPALLAGLDDPAPEVRRRAARTLWLREHALAGARAATRDSYAAGIPRTIAALADPAPARRGTARRRLAWAAQVDLGATAEPWRAWWAEAQADWRPTGAPPPEAEGSDGTEKRR